MRAMVFEYAVTHESRERLLSDAKEKHFINTSIMVWIGLKVKLNEKQDSGDFWLRWRRRRAIGSGLRLKQQTEDANGFAIFVPIHTQNPLTNGLNIFSQAIFALLRPPANSFNLLLAFDDVRLAISVGLIEFQDYLFENTIHAKKMKCPKKLLTILGMMVFEIFGMENGMMRLESVLLCASSFHSDYSIKNDMDTSFFSHNPDARIITSVME